MNNQKLQDDIKKRRTSPYFSSTYKDLPAIDFDKVKGMSDLLEAIAQIDPKTSRNKKCCSDPKKYKNGIGGLIFWSCRNCGADLGDVND